MKRALFVTAIICLATIGTSEAQEHWKEGPVWECDAYRTKPGKYGDYMRYLRENVAEIRAEAKKAGMFVDQKVFVQKPSDPSDWNVMFCTAYENGSAAFGALFEKFLDQAGRFRVQANHGFVYDHKRLVLHKHRGHNEFLAHAMGIAFDEIISPVVQVKQFEEMSC